jgi:hypothetical protein
MLAGESRPSPEAENPGYCPVANAADPSLPVAPPPASSHPNLQLRRSFLSTQHVQHSCGVPSGAEEARCRPPPQPFPVLYPQHTRADDMQVRASSALMRSFVYEHDGLKGYKAALRVLHPDNAANAPSLFLHPAWANRVNIAGPSPSFELERSRGGCCCRCWSSAHSRREERLCIAQSIF